MKKRHRSRGNVFPGKGGADGQEKRKVRLLLRLGNITLYRIPLRSLPARYMEGALFPDPPFQSSDGTISFETANDQANIYFCTFFRGPPPPLLSHVWPYDDAVDLYFY